nr:MAG TPA: hypothetical protein [Caudoviricetes sp.]
MNYCQQNNSVYLLIFFKEIVVNTKNLCNFVLINFQRIKRKDKYR